MQNAALSNAGLGVVHEQAARPRTWRRVSLFGFSLVGTGLTIVLCAIVLSGADPSGLAFVAPMLAITGGVGYLVSSRGRWAQGVGAAAALALVALTAPMASHAPIDSFFDVAPLVLALTGAVTILVGAGADLSRRKVGERTPGVLVASGATVAAVLGLLAVVSAIATYAGQETLTAAEREGALRVATKDSAFTTKTITATEGETVRIALKNSDAVIHDLRIKSLDLKTTVKPGSEKLMEFTAPVAGSYAFDCSLHTNMKGTLEVLAK
jgi:plastocyanin